MEDSKVISLMINEMSAFAPASQFQTGIYLNDLCSMFHPRQQLMQETRVQS